MVADRGLGLTPLIFLGAGILFVLTTLTYVEGGAMYRERGGSSTFARHAFNELISFIAGWAILIDYMIVIALAAITVPHYLTPICARVVGEPGGDGRRGRGDRRRRGRSTSPASPAAAAGGAAGRCSRSPTSLLQLAVIVVGVARRLRPGAADRPSSTSFTSPEL